MITRQKEDDNKAEPDAENFIFCAEPVTVEKVLCSNLCVSVPGDAVKCVSQNDSQETK